MMLKSFKINWKCILDCYNINQLQIYCTVDYTKCKIGHDYCILKIIVNFESPQYLKNSSGWGQAPAVIYIGHCQLWKPPWKNPGYALEPCSVEAGLRCL